MDLSSPISSVIPCAQGVVLAVLARTDAPLSGRRIAVLAGGRVGQRQANEVLKRLHRAGLVTRESHPPAFVYRLNREHLAAGAIVAMAGLRDEMLSRMSAAAERWDPPAVAVWLFGSAARGDGGPDSDVDILVLRDDRVAQDDPAWERQVDELGAQVRNWTGNPCAVLEYSTSEFARLVAAGERLIAELQKDAIRLAGESVARRCRRASR